MSIRDGLVAEYTFAGNADDTSGCGRHGAVHGAMLTADRFGRADHAYHFDGIDDYIEVAPPPVLSAQGLSVSVWVRYEPRDLRGWTNCIVAQDDGNDEDQSRRVFQLSTDSGHIVWHRMMGARAPMCRRRVRPGVWCHVVAVHEGGENRLYVDGVLHDTATHQLWTDATQPMHIGRKGTPEPYFFFLGDIDDVRVYDRGLSAAEVSVLLREGGWGRTPPHPVSGDPLSGCWGEDGVVFLDLQYDGDRAVRGRIMGGQPNNMAAIERGTFDRDSAGLQLEVARATREQATFPLTSSRACSTRARLQFAHASRPTTETTCSRAPGRDCGSRAALFALISAHWRSGCVEGRLVTMISKGAVP